MDFTLKSYKKLLETFISEEYSFTTFESFLHTPPQKKVIILRHDVDELADNALKIAKLENSLNVRATYYFRTVRQSNNPEVIRKIASMGHEIGYHYEDLSSSNGDYKKAILSFEKNLQYFRQFYPVRTISMHGSSSSKFDNRDLWNHFKFEDFGLIGEPYISLDFNTIFYLTDTGFSWDGGKYAVRDVVDNNFGISFHSSQQIIQCLKEKKFPNSCMILSHTLWTDNIIQWTWLHVREFLRNHIKLLAKNNPLISKLYRKMVSLYWNHSQ